MAGETRALPGGLLAIDRNANGTIDDASELFGSPTVNGFEALAALDSNSDGVIDTADDDFGELRIWRDLNQDTHVDAGELQTLNEAGIVSISLDAQADGSQNSGNT